MSDDMRIYMQYDRDERKPRKDDKFEPASEYFITLRRGDGKSMTQNEVNATLTAYMLRVLGVPQRK